MTSSFIIRFHSARHDNLAQLLRFMDLWHENTINQAELITVCQDKFDKKINSEKWASHKHFDLNLIEMNLAYMTNFAVHQTTNEKLVMLDGDRILPAKYFDYVIPRLRKGMQFTTRKILKLTRPHDDQMISDNTINSNCEFRSEQEGKNMWSGNTIFMKSDFLNAGGMDELYVGYGFEDNDMTQATQKYGTISIYREKESEIHLWHEPLTYGVAEPKEMYIKNAVRFCKKWSKPLPENVRQDMLDNRKFII